MIEESSLESVKTYGKAGRPKGGGGKPKTEHEKPFKTIFDVAPELVGCLDSGISDLGSNKKHLEGFGTKEVETLISKYNNRH